MKRAIVSFAAITAFGTAVAAAQPARADLQIVQTTTIDCPGVKSMLREIPEEKRAPLLQMMSPMLTGTPWVTTTYLQGSRMRTDMGQTTMVVNAQSGKEFTLNHVTHRYSIGAYDPFQKSAGSFSCQIAPTGQTSTMLGHPVQKYAITMYSSVLPKSAIGGELWAAPDLPTPPTPGYAAGGMAAGFESQMAKVKGMPLAYHLVYENTPAGTITVTSYATQMSAQPLPQEAFRIPSDYHQGVTRIATQTPSAGYPLGDGMPLDSLEAVTSEMATGQGIASASDLSGTGELSAGSLQQMLGGLSGGGSGAGNSLQGLSPSTLSGLLGGLGGGSAAGAAGGGDLSSLVNPQMLKQLRAQLQSLLSDDE